MTCPSKEPFTSRSLGALAGRVARVALLGFVAGGSGCAVPPCSYSEECPSGTLCVIGVDGARCTFPPLAPPVPAALVAPPVHGKPRIVLVEASTSPLATSAGGGGFSLAPLRSVLVRP